MGPIPQRTGYSISLPFLFPIYTKLIFHFCALSDFELCYQFVLINILLMLLRTDSANLKLAKLLVTVIMHFIFLYKN